ncbi:MAG TPA: glucose-6-phosphate dehydrogenase, partial [Anaeromyxobacteraceae bacterium]
GASGDLTRRKLVPALYNLLAIGLLPERFGLVGAMRRPMDDAAFREELRQALGTFSSRPQGDWDAFAPRVHAVSGDLGNVETYRRLAGRLEELHAMHGAGGNALFYLATPPEAFAEIACHLGAAGLLREEAGRWRRVVVEKPFGRDTDSARALNREILSVAREDQIFRIDHYLGKETVQNLLVFRFANGIFEPVWNRRYVDHVQITVAEELGVEGRGGYYDRSGALRDVIQNHVFGLLSLVAMEPPSTLAGEAVRNEKMKVLEAVRPMSHEEILQAAVRGQYGEGLVGGRNVPAYRAEPTVPPGSKTETYAALRLQVDNWRWAGVPFYLRSGKRLARRDTHISIQFKAPPLLLFRDAGLERVEPNRLEIHVQPEESIRMTMKAKVPGPTIRLQDVRLSFSYQDFGPLPAATGYERLLYDVMTGDATLYHRADMVEAAWRIATPILDLWESLPARDFPNYAAGSWGPEPADDLLAKDGRRWVNG